MTNGWPLVTIEDILQLQRRWIDLEPDKLCTEIGMRSFGRGLFHKSPVIGLSLGNKRVLRVCPGDLVFNNVFAWEGAVGVASEGEAGTIGSHRFVTYTIKDNRADARFLQLFFRTEAGLDILRKVSPGSAGRNRTLNLDQFAKQQVPLPPFPEQRRIVAKVEELSAKIEEARGLRRQATESTGRVLGSAMNEFVGLMNVDGILGGRLVEKPRNGWSPHCDNSEGGTPVLSLGAVTGFRYSGVHHKQTSLPTSPGAHYWLRPGDLLITRSNTPELVGHAAIYDGSPSPCIYSDLMMRLIVDSSKADPCFVWYWLQTPLVREFIAGHATGTSSTMKKISQGTVMAIPFPSKVSLAEQRRIVAYLDDLQAKVDCLKTLQAQTAAELDALLPSVLDKAFKGEL